MSREQLFVGLLWLGIAATAMADQSTFQLTTGGSRTFYGFLQNANPQFVQGYLGQVGYDGTKGTRLTVRLWRWRQGTWAPFGTKTANEQNGEGEAAMGYPCGWSYDLSGGSSDLRGGDYVVLQIVYSAEGTPVQQAFLFNRLIGAAAPPGSNTNLGDNGGVADFQGRITQIRPDSIRGYAFDDLYLAGYNGPNIFPSVSVQVEVGQRPLSSDVAAATGAFQTIDTISATANEQAEKPLYLTTPPGQNSQATMWPYGFTANLSQRLAPGNEYQITLYEVSWNKLVLDRRIYRVSNAGEVAVISDFTVLKSGPAGGNRLEPGHDWTSKRDSLVAERMTSRALLSKDEFYRMTPEGTGEGKTTFFKPAPEMLYQYPGAAVDFKRGSLPPPSGKQASSDEINLKDQGKGDAGHLGGFSADKTRDVWVKLYNDPTLDPSTRAQKKSYVYEWYFAEPSYEQYLDSLFTNTVAKRLEKTWAGLKLPASSPQSPVTSTPGSPLDPANPGLGPQPPTSSTSSASGTTTVTNDYITIYLDTKGQPMPWSSLTDSQRQGLVDKHHAKLDKEFNFYDNVQLGVAAFSRAVIDKKNQQSTAQQSTTTPPPGTPLNPGDPQTASNPLTDPTSNPSVDDTKIATIAFKLQGDHLAAPYDDSGKKNHPLFVSVHYVYDKGVDALKTTTSHP